LKNSAEDTSESKLKRSAEDPAKQKQAKLYEPTTNKSSTNLLEASKISPASSQKIGDLTGSPASPQKKEKPKPAVKPKDFKIDNSGKVVKAANPEIQPAAISSEEPKNQESRADEEDNPKPYRPKHANAVRVMPSANRERAV
jgi:hypothetical protein